MEFSILFSNNGDSHVQKVINFEIEKELHLHI